MELLLFIGLAGLLFMHLRLLRRVERLEAEAQFLPPAAETEAPAVEPTMAQPSPLSEPRAAPALEAEPEEAPSQPAVRETLASLFERFVGGRLLVWIGGIALAVAGVLLVAYSIEIGLITPPVRMMMAAAFGLLLLGAGELARARAGDDFRPAQALVGAGILVLYAAAYGSYILYALISLGTASVLMVLVTAAALALSLRHGAPTAVMGLAGGFATPLLIGDPDAGALPLLGYLGLLNVAIFAISSRRGWAWLAASAVLLSFAWTGLLLFWPANDALAAGAFIVALGVAGSLVRAGEGWQLEFVRPAGLGLLQLAVLVARTDLGIEAWGLFGLLAFATLFLSERREEYRPLPALALLLALILLAFKAWAGGDPNVPLVAAAITALFGAYSIPKAVLGPNPMMWTLIGGAAFAAPALILRSARPELLSRPAWGLVLVLLAAGPAFLAWNRRGRGGDAPDRPMFAAAAAALLLLGAAAYDLVPLELLGSAWLLLALGTAVAAGRLKDRGLSLLAILVTGIAAWWTVAMVPGLWLTIGYSLSGVPALVTGLPSPSDTLQLLVVPVPLLLLVWWTLPSRQPRLRTPAFALAGLFLAGASYILFKQIFALSSAEDFVARGFAERTIITQALFFAGWLFWGRRHLLPGLDEALAHRTGTVLTALAAARLVWFDMLIHNPVLSDQWVGTMPVLNYLAPAYLLSAFWLYRFRRRAGGDAVSGIWLTLSLAALTMGVMLIVRQLFQGPILTAASIPSAESYGYSLAGLLLSVALLLAGIRLPDKALRLAGLILLTATIVKVFLIDAAALGGLLRILSFLGLGIALIGIGKLYTKVLRAEARPR